MTDQHAPVERPSEPEPVGTSGDWPSRRAGLRGQLAAALREHGMVHLGDQVPADEYDCCAEAVLATVADQLEIGEEQAWCKTCRRAWNSPAHRCESDAEQQVQRITELRGQWVATGAPPLGVSINRWWDKRLAELGAVLNERPDAPAWTPPPPGDQREQLPDHLLALISIPAYLSTACGAAKLLERQMPHALRRPELGDHADRLHSRCRLQNKFTGACCRCHCHGAPGPAVSVVHGPAEQPRTTPNNPAGA